MQPFGCRRASPRLSSPVNVAGLGCIGRVASIVRLSLSLNFKDSVQETVSGLGGLITERRVGLRRIDIHCYLSASRAARGDCGHARVARIWDWIRRPH